MDWDELKTPADIQAEQDRENLGKAKLLAGALIGRYKKNGPLPPNHSYETTDVGLPLAQLTRKLLIDSGWLAEIYQEEGKLWINIMPAPYKPKEEEEVNKIPRIQRFIYWIRKTFHV